MAKRASGRRTTVKNRAGTFYAKRTTAGRFKEMAEKGRSLKADPGYGDRGDRRRAA
jgi:hypothetical protein